MHQLRYGESATIDLELSDDTQIVDFSQASGTVIEDPSSCVAEALHDPVQFPSIEQATVPGDQIVIALDPDVPQAGAILRGVVQALIDASVEPDHITVLQAKGHSHAAELAAELPTSAEPVRFAVHDPDNREQLAYLAASKEAAPIVLNRLLCDADLVIPINLLRPASTLLYTGPHGGLCPTFADTATQQRYRTPNAMIPLKQQRYRREEADEIAWLLGIQLTIQVIAGPDDSVFHVLAGLDQDVSRRGQELVEAAWGFDIPEKADLVVAAIAGQQDSQSWENFSRALHTAQQVCTKDGTIILCTELPFEPGHALKRLATFDEKERLLQRLGNDRSEDAISAWLLMDARDTNHVFLLSKLDESAVESLGIGYIDKPEQINHIARQCTSCVLIGDARAFLRIGE